MRYLTTLEVRMYGGPSDTVRVYVEFKVRRSQAPGLKTELLRDQMADLISRGAAPGKFLLKNFIVYTSELSYRLTS